jgi:hypothetical protein
METKETPVLLREIVRKSKNHVDACIKEDIGVICFNRKLQKKKAMPFRILYENNNQFWLQNEAWEYYVARDEFAKIEERTAQLNSQWTVPPGLENATIETPVTVKPVPQPTNNVNMSDSGFGEGFVTFSGLSEIERVMRMQD